MSGSRILPKSTPASSAEPPRQFITRECADMLAGRQPSPYLRAHERVQAAFADFAASEQGHSPDWRRCCERFVHFRHEVSLADLPRTGPGQDECLTLVFEAAFDLARCEPDWATACLRRGPPPAGVSRRSPSSKPTSEGATSHTRVSSAPLPRKTRRCARPTPSGAAQAGSHFPVKCGSGPDCSPLRSPRRIESCHVFAKRCMPRAMRGGAIGACTHA